MLYKVFGIDNSLMLFNIDSKQSKIADIIKKFHFARLCNKLYQSTY